MVSPIQDVYATPIPSATTPTTGTPANTGTTGITPTELDPSAEATTADKAKDEASQVVGTAKDQATEVAGTAKDQATEVAGTAKEQATEVAGTAKEQAAQVLGTVGEQASSLIAESQEQLTMQAATQKDRAASGLREISGQLASMAENGRGLAGQLVSETAHRSGGLADYLDAHTPGELLEELRDLGRRRSGGFLLGAAALGFVGGRLLKGAKSDAADAPSVDTTTGVTTPYAAGALDE